MAAGKSGHELPGEPPWHCLAILPDDDSVHDHHLYSGRLFLRRLLACAINYPARSDDPDIGGHPDCDPAAVPQPVGIS